MSKKILAMLMALAMIISMVPMTALAAGDHTCEGDTWISNGDLTHTSYCKTCGEDNQTGPCQSFNGTTCYMCHGSMTAEPEQPEEPECDHEGSAWISNGDGTHTSSCACGANSTSGACYNLGDGTCYMCGYVFPVEEPACNHQGGAWISNGDGTHTSSCACGANSTSGSCYNLGSGKCYMCGYAFPVEEHNCTFEAGVTSNQDGTHNVNCSCGESVTVNCLDNDGDGKCDSCGYQKYPSHKCDFEAGVTSNQDGTHNVNCSCGKFVKVTCLDSDGDGKCDSCGYQKYIAPESEHEHNYIAHSNNDGTHLLTCNCGKSVTVNCLDSDGDGKCDSCGYQKYPTCSHEGGPWTSNDDGTHTSSCKCGKNTVTGVCQFIGNSRKCYMCGYEKHVDNDHPQKPAVDPKPVINYKDYDDVPKTGDILSMILAFFGF